MGRFHSLFRILPNGLTGVSAVLFVGTIALWMRSYGRDDLLNVTFNRHVDLIGNRDIFDVIYAESESGRFTVGANKDVPLTKPPGSPLFEFWANSGSGEDSFVFPLQFSVDGNHLTLTYWPIAVAAAILPALALVRIRRRRASVRLGCCANCGYDLRASPGRCPECGVEAGRLATDT